MNIEVIWQQHRSLLQKYLASKVSNPSDAEDLLQNILLKTHQSLHTLTDRTKVQPWLLQIAKHTIIDFYRKQAKQRELVSEDLWYEQEQQTEHELAECLKPFITCLPEKYQHPLLAIDVNGQEQKDFAKQQDINYSTLKSRVQKGRLELRELFEQCCDLELDKLGNAIGCKKIETDCNGC